MGVRQLITVLSLFMLTACGGGTPTTTGQPDAVYDVRGKIIGVSGAGENARVTVEHEAIPAFKDRDGVASTMPAMTMAFGLAPEVDKSALIAGSVWELRFEVVWSREPALRVLSAKPLPADTALTLTK
jgi:hypothetical protein